MSTDPESDTSWTEVRRSVPAEHVAGVPDDATVWACWVHDDTYESVTIYHVDAEECYVIKNDAESQMAFEGPVEKSEALDIAEEAR